MFIHWGPVTLKGTEIGWSRGKEVPADVYDKLYKNFNPTKFNAESWINLAKESGMKYFIITAKHHDGFSLWHSPFTDYDIEATPFKIDILKELQLAAEKNNILFGTYYSILDWYHPDYTTRHGDDPRPINPAGMPIYKKFLFNQVQELIENYNSKIFWFDGQFEDSWTHKDGMELYKFIRNLKDDILINNRVDKGFKGMEGMTDNLKKYAGDFGTPEQQIGKFNEHHPWESCITLGEQWAWKPNDKLKSANEVIKTLIKIVGGNGNLLLNIGPMPDGEIETRQVEILKQVGNWLKINGEAIFDTKGGPYEPNETYASTNRGDVIYIHILDTKISELTLPIQKSFQNLTVKNLNNNEIPFNYTNGELKIDLTSISKNERPYVFKIIATL